MNIARAGIIATAIWLSTGSAIAQENSGFLTDYSILQRSGENVDVLMFFKDGVADRIASYDAIMVDQPELFINDDSKYKGMKPETMLEIAEEIRGSIIEGLGESFGIADEPAANVLYLRMAATDLYIKKGKRGVLGYTPVGFVAKGVKDKLSEFVENNALIEMTLEVEMQDSLTGEVLAAGFLSRGQRKDRKQDLKEEPVNWERLHFAFNQLGKRMACRLNNAHLEASERVDCLQIPVQPEDE